MARPYSKDLRDRVATFVVSGGTCREAAARFGVGVATAVRWSQRLRTSGSAAASNPPNTHTNAPKQSGIDGSTDESDETERSRA